jgi:hypothetical protein
VVSGKYSLNGGINTKPLHAGSQVKTAFSDQKDILIFRRFLSFIEAYSHFVASLNHFFGQKYCFDRVNGYAVEKMGLQKIIKNNQKNY